MKNLITLLTVLTISFTTAFASTTPEAIVSTPAVEVTNVSAMDLISGASFDEDSQNLTFETSSDIKNIKVMNAQGEVTFTLPVMSNVVNINKNLFDQGANQLGFQIEGSEELHITQVSIR